MSLLDVSLIALIALLCVYRSIKKGREEWRKTITIAEIKEVSSGAAKRA